MIAGYCYEWISGSEPDGSDYDIGPEDGFRAKMPLPEHISSLNHNKILPRRIEVHQNSRDSKAAMKASNEAILR